MHMKKGLLILIPLIVLAVWTSRPTSVPAQQEVVTPSVKEQEPAEVVKTLGLKILPEQVIQGEPLLVQVEGLLGTTTVRSITFNNASIPVFQEDGLPSGLIGLDLRMTPGTYPLAVTLSDGRVIRESVVVNKRKIETAPFGIPDKLGGNTPEAEQTLGTTLIQEAKIISAIPTSDARRWTTPFALPLTPPITITDVYGYSRETGASTFAHKGTDFRAAIGTPVKVIGDGRVAYVDYLRNYGHVIAVDHGARVLSIYMHLSQVSVSVGQEVKRGDVIALSGDTGYVLGPHLHLTVRIAGISIDPMIFFELLGEGSNG